MEKANTELKKLYPQERENQEENILIAMLRSDIDSYRNERFEHLKHSGVHFGFYIK